MEQDRHSLRVVPQWKTNVEDSRDESVLVSGDGAQVISVRQ